MTALSQNFVNDARNICWVSGVIKRIDPTTVLICPSTDVTQCFHVNTSLGLLTPPDGSVVEANCHLYGTHSKETNTRSMRLEAIYFKRASLAAMPKKLALFQPFLSRNNPLASKSEVREAVHKTMSRADFGEDQGDIKSLVDSMMREAEKGRFQASFANKVILTGFVGAKAVRQASENEDAHLYAQIHQFPETERALPVRVYGNVSALSQAMRTLFPINLVGEVAFTDTPNAEGVVTRSYFVRVSKPADVGSAQSSDFRNSILPQWWVNAFVAHRARQDATRAALLTPEPRPEAPRATPVATAVNTTTRTDDDGLSDL